MGAADPRPSQPISTAADAQKIVDGAERVIRRWHVDQPRYVTVDPLIDDVRAFLCGALGLVAAAEPTDWRPAKINDRGQLEEDIAGVGRVGTMVLYPAPRCRLVVSESTNTARFEPEADDRG